MKVIEVVYNWPAETFIQRHIQALQQIPFPVQVVARHTPDAFSESASLGGENENIHAEIMPNFNHLKWTGKLASLRYLSAASRRMALISEKVLLGYFDRLHPDLIHFHDATLAALMSWIPRSLGIPYTMSLRGSDVHTLALLTESQRAAILAAIEHASSIHSVCHALGQTARDQLRHPFNFSVIYTSLPMPSALTIYKSVPDGGPFHFLAIGRLLWIKGFDSLLFALRLLLDTGLDVRLTLVGVGPEMDHLRHLRKMLGLEEVVELPGKLSFAQIQGLYKITNAYIQSSLAEGLSNSLVEAMAYGLPVFATDVGGTNEVIKDGVTGFLLPPLAPQDWLEKLILVRDTALMERIRVSAYEKTKQLFSAEHHAREFAAFYEQAGGA